MHKFTIRKPANMESVLAQVSTKIRNGGGTFTGSKTRGDFSGSGVSGFYTVGDCIEITVVKKPFVVTMSMIEARIRDFFAAA